MKHAYLIMAHGEPYILERLLKSIDDERNDIFLHADRKWHNFDAGKIQSFVKKSRLFFTPRLDIRWGAFSQIECELSLLKMATGNGKYAYYHLLSGVDITPRLNATSIGNAENPTRGRSRISMN